MTTQLKRTANDARGYHDAMPTACLAYLAARVFNSPDHGCSSMYLASAGSMLLSW